MEEKDSAAERIANIIVTVILVVSIVFTAYIMICAASGKAASIFGRSVLRVVTGSMEPSIHVDDYILVKKVEFSEIAVGDIISYYSENKDISGKLVTHRVTKINEDNTLMTKGDANTIEDELPVRADQICGRYTGRARFFNWITSFADTRKLLLILVIIPLMAISIYEVKSLAGLVKKVEEEKKLERDEKNRAEAEERIRQIKEEALRQYLAGQHAAELDKKASDAEKKAEELKARALRVEARAEELARQLAELNAGAEEKKFTVFVPEKQLKGLPGIIQKIIGFFKKRKGSGDKRKEA